MSCVWFFYVFLMQNKYLRYVDTNFIQNQCLRKYVASSRRQYVKVLWLNPPHGPLWGRGHSSSLGGLLVTETPL